MAKRRRPRTSGNSQTRPDHVHAEERRALVIELKERGATYRVIADVVRERYAGICPAGYSEQSAYRDVRYVLDRAAERQLKARGPLRELHFRRLERLHLAFYDLALRGDNDAFAKCYKVLEREAKMYGVDATQMTNANAIPLPVHQERCLLILHLVQAWWHDLAPSEEVYLAGLGRLQSQLEAAAARLGLPQGGAGTPEDPGAPA